VQVGFASWASLVRLVNRLEIKRKSQVGWTRVRVELGFDHGFGLGSELVRFGSGVG
jgi:hypothetical protein